MFIWTYDKIVEQPEPPTKETIARERKRQLDFLREFREKLMEGERSKSAAS